MAARKILVRVGSGRWSTKNIKDTEKSIEAVLNTI